jgi:rsbT antagonist protein RsbS
VAVPILKQGANLIASLHSALSDADWREFVGNLLEQVGRFRSFGVVIDVTAVDVLDSFATRILRSMVEAIRLRGAQTVVVGVQPEVAFAMVRLGLTARLEGVATALDLEEGLELLQQCQKRGGNAP